MEFRFDVDSCAATDIRGCEAGEPGTCSCDLSEVEEPDWGEQQFECEDFGSLDYDPSLNYWVRAVPEKDEGLVYFEGELPGGRRMGVDRANYFTVLDPSRNRVEANTNLEVYDLAPGGGGPGALRQQITFHSSCSQELYLFDIFGSFQLVEFESNEDGVIGGFQLPVVDFNLTLRADAISGTDLLELDFLSIVVLSAVPGELPPQVETFNVTGQTVTPGTPFTVSSNVTIVPRQDVNLIATIGGTADGVGCFDVSNATFLCEPNIEVE